MYKTKIAKTKETIKEMGACHQVDRIKRVLHELHEEHTSTWPRPCIEGYPCFFTQHRSNIRREIRWWENELSIQEQACNRSLFLEMHNISNNRIAEQRLSNIRNDMQKVIDKYADDSNETLKDSADDSQLKRG